jgi:putative component of membrane protein insertase Oxa1/YidC/SpoIIIJ protein YidD
MLFSSVLRVIVGNQILCRYNPTCSVYMKQMIVQKGIKKGGLLGLRQLLSCHPFKFAI